jgi:hypothetical protein
MMGFDVTQSSEQAEHERHNPLGAIVGGILPASEDFIQSCHVLLVIH